MRVTRIPAYTVNRPEKYRGGVICMRSFRSIYETAMKRASILPRRKEKKDIAEARGTWNAY